MSILAIKVKSRSDFHYTHLKTINKQSKHSLKNRFQKEALNPIIYQTSWTNVSEWKLDHKHLSSNYAFLKL